MYLKIYLCRHGRIENGGRGISMSDTSLEEKLSQKINQRQRYEKKKIEYSSSHLFDINSNINKFSKRKSNYHKRSANLS